MLNKDDGAAVGLSAADAASSNRWLKHHSGQKTASIGRANARRLARRSLVNETETILRIMND